MLSLRNPRLWGVGLVVLLLAVALVSAAAFALRNQPQTITAAQSEPIPTWTPTPAAGSTADPALTGAAAAALPPTPVAAPADPADPAATAGLPVAEAPEAQPQVAGATAGADSGTGSAAALGAPNPHVPATDLAPTPTLASLTPAGILAQALLLHRYGDYANARALLTRVLDDNTTPAELQRQAQYDLARAYLADGLYAEALAALDQLDTALAGDGNDSNQFGQKEEFLRGEALLGQAQYSDAVAAYWRFLDAYPWMGESVQPRIAQAYLALGDPASAATAFRHAADVSSENTSKAYLLEQVAQAHLAAGQYAEAVAAYDEILAFAANAAYRAQLQYQAGGALANAGDGPAAIERWRAAAAESPESRSAYLSLVELVNREVDFDLYQRGYIDLFAEAYEPAIAAFQAYLDATDASDARHASALHRLGQSYLGAGDYTAAIARLDEVIANYPDCDCFGLAWLHKAMAQAGMGDTAAARRTYRTLARDYPDNEQAPEALWLSGRQALAEGNQLEAAVDFLALADRFPNSERAPQALYALGIGAITKGLYGQAAPLFARLQQNYPDYRWDAAGYWLGRSYAANGEDEQARATWQTLVERAPDIYYGVLAAYGLAGVSMTDAAALDSMAQIAGPAGRLEGDDGSQAFAEQWLAAWITDTTAADLASLPIAVSEDQNLAKGRLLLEMDQRGDALVVLERVYDRHSDDPHALYALSMEFARLGVYRLSLLSASRLLILSGIPLVEDGPIFIQRLAYPRPFNDLIVSEAQANGLNPLVYFSLIRQESLFEEGAQSSAAAQGLAQIIPDTGQWIAERLGHPEYTNAIIYRPVVNLRFGAYYLNWVRNYLDGNLLSALAGYNAGPGNAQTWRAASGPDDTLFTELLTYSEPRVYIQAVLSNLYHYARLYAE